MAPDSHAEVVCVSLGVLFLGVRLTPLLREVALMRLIWGSLEHRCGLASCPLHLLWRGFAPHVEDHVTAIQFKSAQWQCHFP